MKPGPSPTAIIKTNRARALFARFNSLIDSSYFVVATVHIRTEKANQISPLISRAVEILVVVEERLSRR